jgi:hypothetical protein
MSLPPRRKNHSWKHPIGPEIAWVTSIEGGRHGTVEEMRRTGREVDVHVLGKRVTALAPPQQRLPWTITVRGPARRHPTEVELHPGSEQTLCNPNEFSGCQFAIEPSLEKAGIRFRWMCGIRDELFSIAGYEIVTSDGRAGYLREVVGGGHTRLTIMFSKARLLRSCRPGTPRH